MWADVRARAALVAVVLVLLAACWVRAAGLPSVQGTMGRDEARLALAARGILEHGLPILPDGFLYTRGLLPAYLEAATFAVAVGQRSGGASPIWCSGAAGGGGVSARAAGRGHGTGACRRRDRRVLPAAGAPGPRSLALLVVPVLAGAGGRLAGARRPGDRVRAGLAAWAALLSHELAVLLVPIAALLDLGPLVGSHRRRTASSVWRPRPPAAVLVFWAMLLAGGGRRRHAGAGPARPDRRRHDGRVSGVPAARPGPGAA